MKEYVKHLSVAAYAAAVAGLAVMPKDGAINWRFIAIDAGRAGLLALGGWVGYRAAKK